MGTLYADSSGTATNSGSSDNNAADLSGVAGATVVANITFADADVNTGTDVITKVAHGYTTGTGVELTTTGTLPAGLTLITMYYLRAATADTLTLHPSVADAEANTNIVNITAAAGGGTHTVNNHTINLAATPDLSAVRGHHCYVTTTGTSHVITMCGGVHGMATGDDCFLRIASGGTIPGGVSANRAYYINALTTTTFRIYTTAALATAGGASDINVTSAGARSLFVQSAASGDTLALTSSSVTNRTIFWIRAVSNTNDLVICEQVITLSATSDWYIGGRVSVGGLTTAWATLRNGDALKINTDLSAAALVLTLRNGINASYDTCKIESSSGTRRVIASTSGAATLLALSNGISANCENLEFQQQATGGLYSSSGTGMYRFFNCRLTDNGATVSACTVMADCEVSNGVTLTSSTGNLTPTFVNTIFSALTGDMSTGSGPVVYINCIFDRITGRSIAAGGLNVSIIAVNCTIYRSGATGVRATGISNGSGLVLLNSIVKDNGDASTEYNFESFMYSRMWAFYERRNCFNISGALGGGNIYNHTVDATDITTDPLLVAPDAAAGSRDFGLQAGSPALAASFAYLNTSTTTYSDMGAAQKQATSGGGGGATFNRIP